MTHSIRVDLLKWLITPLLTINLVGAFLVYILAWAPAQQALDHNLAEIAFDLRMYLHGTKEGITLELPYQAERILRSNEGDLTFFVVRSASETIAGDNDFPSLPVPPRIGEPHVYDGVLRNQPVRFLVVSAVVDEQNVYIGVAETLAKRREMQAQILLTLLALEFTLVAVSVAIVWFAVTEGLFPLQKMQAELDARAPGDLYAMKEDLPEELRPLSRAINDLLQRVDEDGKARQGFLANVAHQLRTPLAGLKTQLTLVQGRQMGEADRLHTLGLMMRSTDRMIRQTNQLLALARAEPSQKIQRRTDIVDLNLLVAESIQSFVLAADSKGIDIGFELAPAPVAGDRFLLLDLIDNVVDNAIRYTQEGGAVTVSCRQEDGVSLFAVEDNGPGIPVPDREAVFGRFHRLDVKQAGSGLGLSIVRDIAQIHHAAIDVTSPATGVGTLFSVRFTRAPASAGAA